MSHQECISKSLILFSLFEGNCINTDLFVGFFLLCVVKWNVFFLLLQNIASCSKLICITDWEITCIRDAGYAKHRVHENKNKDHCIAKDIFNKMSMKAE